MSHKAAGVDFLLINPTAREWRIAPGRKPSPRTRIFRFSMLTSLSVAAAMPVGVRTRIVDEEVEPLDLGVDTDLVGISCMTFNAPRAYQIADSFRERGIPVVMGGYHPTFLPQEALRHADAVCIGEVEAVMPRIMKDFEEGRMAGAYTRAAPDLANLCRPDRSLLSPGSYAWVDTVQASRGCPNSCRFCSISAFFQSTYRTRPVEDVVDELRGLSRFILFMDDNLTAHRDYAMELFSRMIPLKKRWFSQASVHVAHEPELLELAAASGCSGLFLGLESVCQESLEEWGKPLNRAADYQRAIKKLHSKGIGVVAGVVLGADQDTPDVFDRTLAFLEEARMDALQATILTPFPGTPLFSSMEEEGRILHRHWEKYDFRHVVFRPERMSVDTLREGHRRVLTRFYSRSSVLKRFLNQVRYLSPSSMFMASIPVNMSYRRRLTANRTFL